MSSYTEYHKRYYESKVKGQRAAKREALQKELAEVTQAMKEIENRGLSIEVEEYLRRCLEKRYEKLVKGVGK